MQNVDVTGGIVHGVAQIRTSDVVEIVTPEAQWAYAYEVSFGDVRLAVPLTCNVEIGIRTGAVGIAVLDGSGAVLVEQMVEGGVGKQLVPIGVAGGVPASLVIRNFARHGASEADLVSIRLSKGYTPPKVVEAPPQIPAPPELLNHPSFGGLSPQRVMSTGGMSTSAIGQRTRFEFDKSVTVEEGWDRDRWEQNPLPWSWLHEEIYEWIALADAVQAAKGRFTIIELGAGYGRWMVAGGVLAHRLRPGLPVKLVGVEADPAHFQWMRQHLLDNDFAPDDHDLHEAAIGAESGTVLFCENEDPAGDYGQHVAEDGSASPGRMPPRVVPAIGINDLLRQHDRIDLLDADIQGYERMVIPAGMEEMTKRVRRAYISIHEPSECEEEVAASFREHGWRNVVSFPFKTVATTEFGPVHFIDGCQYWINPRLE